MSLHERGLYFARNRERRTEKNNSTAQSTPAADLSLPAWRQLPMGSYYREHVSFPNVAAGPYPPHVIAELERSAVDAATGSSNSNDNGDDPDSRICSVKGCSAQLPVGYTNKMCEECRGRHRVYAMTKRAKRKMEKALLNGPAAQNGQVVWMPQDDGVQQEQEQPVAGPSRQYESQPQDHPRSASENVHFEFPAEWDPQAIDPRLFSQASELAGALTLPGTALQSVPGRNMYAGNSHQQQQQPQQPPPQPPQQPPRQAPSHTRSSSLAPPPPATVPEIHPILAEVLKAVPNFSLSTRITSGPTVDSSGSSEGPLPPRFCSIKGCKTLIAGNSFFKMCEPCRDRYRNYGTTKRAKWRREKEVAVQELHKLRAEEDARRAAEGLPPLPPPDEEQWQEFTPPADGAAPRAGSHSASGTPAPAPAEGQDPNAPLPPRMCTVSHCREILPGDYQFLRCERHRIQNRHHSKLKRVRDKEVKAHVHDGWAAAVGSQLTGGSAGEDGTEERSVPDVTLSANDIAQVFGELEKELRDGSLAGGEDTPLGEPTSGVPPAARGTRRTNHVCSIKTCSNLLSPSNPWKMCDLCRSRDRASRRLKALRDSGLIPPEVAAGKIVEVQMEVEGWDVRGKGEKKDKKEKGAKKKKKKKGEGVPASTAGEGATATTEAVETVASSSASGSSAVLEVAQQQAGTSATSNTDVDVPMSDGAIDPSALQQTTPGIEPQTSIFSSLPNHASLIFMEPILGELASTIQRHLAQLNSSNPDAASVEPIQPQGIQQGAAAEPTPPSQAAATALSAPPPSPKKTRKAKGKAKAKATSQPSGDVNAVSEHGQSGEASPSATVAANTANPPNAVTASTASGSTEDSVEHPPPPYPPPPNGYPYYMPPPCIPYGQPLNYQYGYPPPPSAPGKGPYPPPPMYQHPYGPYPPYAYAYPGQPYPYPGQAYMSPPPPPGQSYSPPPHQPYPPPSHPYHPPDSSQQHAAQPYPPQLQPYPYSHSSSPPQPASQPPPEPENPTSVYMAYSSRPKSPSVVSVTTSTAGSASPPVTIITPAPTDRAAPATMTNTTMTTAPTTAVVPATTGPSQNTENDKDKSPEHANGQPGQSRTTVITRTTGTYETPPNLLNKPTFALKRRRDEDYYDLVQNKRMESDGAGYSMFQVSLSTTPVAHVPQPAVSPSTSMSSKVQCGNKSCKRVLPNGGSGSLCERCRERLKKKQAKAKHRYKLEPKTLLRRSSGDRSVPVAARA
ncbi:hypothetical protein C8T65DRAFT_829463 [Cerioporus squamosus]|nr:hypothetical protein C8T65DRAFT_829463 [Cerioporus squamosus]